MRWTHGRRNYQNRRRTALEFLRARRASNIINWNDRRGRYTYDVEGGAPRALERQILPGILHKQVLSKEGGGKEIRGFCERHV